VRGPDEFAVHVFVIHANQAARGASLRLREIRHGIGIGAELPVLGGYCVGVQPVVGGQTAGIEIRRAGHKAVTPSRDELLPVAIRDDQGVGVLRCHAPERARG
jgi:hypothetical protein